MKNLFLGTTSVFALFLLLTNCTKNESLTETEDLFLRSSSKNKTTVSAISGTFSIIARHSGKAVEVKGYSTANGGDVVQWTNSGGSNQKWNISDLGNGYYKIINVNSGLALDVSAGSTADGGDVIQWAYNGGNNQQWAITDLGTGYYKIINRNSGKSLDVAARSTADGANVLQWTYSGATNQQFALSGSSSGSSFGLVGYATGTTGGAGGATVTATTFAELKAYLESSTTYIVRVDRRIYNGTKGGKINVNNNKTLLGVGTAGFLDGIGLNISSKSNIIIQNIKITLTSITDTSDPAVYDPDGDEGRPQIIVNGGDCISIQGSSSKVWIDHCEMYEIDPSVQTNQDLYDGLVDIKNSSQNVTISWCYFHDHHKTHLVGSSDSDNYDRRITFHHNYYRHVKERLPSYRFGFGHIFNNYYTAVEGSAINSRMGACLKIENNYFESVTSPIISANSTTTGKWQISGNFYTGISGTQPPTSSTCSFTPPYSYTLDPVSSVKTEVTSKAGIGKL